MTLAVFIRGKKHSFPFLVFFLGNYAENETSDSGKGSTVEFLARWMTRRRRSIVFEIPDRAEGDRRGRTKQRRHKLLAIKLSKTEYLLGPKASTVSRLA